MSLIRQGNLRMENVQFVGEKTWTEDLIQSLGFGETLIFERLPKLSYAVLLKAGHQLDMPCTPAMFTVKAFPNNKQLSEKDYNELLIKFYTRVSQDDKKVWSLLKITKISSAKKTELFEGVFQNYEMSAIRSDGSVCVFTLADLPIMNPSDLIQLLKIFLNQQQFDLSALISHLRIMLNFYYEKLAAHDYVLAKAIKMVIPKPFVYRDGMSKYSEGRILSSPLWGVVFKSVRNKKFVHGFFAMDERELFPSEIILSIVKRIVICPENTDEEIFEVERLLNWTLEVRKEMLAASSIIFPRG